MRGRHRRRWLQDVIDDLRMIAADAGQLAQNIEFFSTGVMAAKFWKGQAT